MDGIVLQEYTTYRETEILDLYRSVGWSAYYEHPQVLRQAFEKSFWVLGAYHGARLTGILRAVGDGETILFIQDILVHPDYQRRSIGTSLVAHTLSRFSRVRQIHLLTDNLPETVSFYKAVGFTPAEQVHCCAFTRVKY